MNLANTLPSLHKPSVVLAGIMLALSIVAFSLRPTQKMADQHTQINIEAMIPQQFGDWQEDKSASNLLVDPTVTESVNKVYLQSISRTYVNAKGQRIMLAVAYGGDQNDMMQVHKPEICYTAQGFHIEKSSDSQLHTAEGAFTVRRMVAVKNNRFEPVTYWVTIGNKVAVNPLQWRLERIRYGLTGVVPDGLLFRVSSIGNEFDTEYKVQEKFVNELMQMVTPDARNRLLGTQEASY